MKYSAKKKRESHNDGSVFFKQVNGEDEKMNREDSIKLLQEMLGIYSPSRKEEKLAAFLRGKFEILGFGNVWNDKAGNIYGEIGSGYPTVLLCGHMDTVPGWIPVRIENGKLYGRGAVDAKSSLAAMICAASSLTPVKGKGRVIVAGVVEEERKAKGIRQLIREGLSVEYAIFGEPSGLRNITFAYKGKIGLTVTCKTVSGHVGAQHLLDNAIEKSFELWRNIKDHCRERQSPHGIFYSLTPSLVNIKSRRTSGGIPDVSILEIDIRLPPTVKPNMAADIIKNVIEKFQAANPSVTISTKITDSVQPFVARRQTPVMNALKKAILEVTGGPVKFLRKTGTGDMNIFGAQTRIPVATYGPGDASLSHTPYERIDLTEYLASIQVYKKATEFLLSSVDID